MLGKENHYTANLISPNGCKLPRSEILSSRNSNFVRPLLSAPIVLTLTLPLAF